MSATASAIAAGIIAFSPQSGVNALSHARDFVYECPCRDGGTRSSDRAAQWIYRRVSRTGCDAELDSFTAPVPGGTAKFTNVIVEFPSPDPAAPWILLTSHFDTKTGMPKGFQGANDGASSTALLIEMARELRKAGRAPDCSLALLWLDGEECRGPYYTEGDGFQGSIRVASRFAEKGRKVAAVVNFDMVGDKNLNISVPRNCTPVLRKHVADAAADIGMPELVTLSDEAIHDDHESFLRAGMPAVTIIDFEYGSSPGKNDWWHTEHDTIDKLSAESLEKTGKLAFAILRRFGYNPVRKTVK